MTGGSTRNAWAWVGVALCGVGLALALAACQSAAMTTDVEQPARLLNPSDAQMQQELFAWMSKQTGLRRVQVPQAELASQSEWVVERRHQFDNRGELIQGRDLELPHRFVLVVQKQQCWLVHRNSGARTLLLQAQCRSAVTP